MLQLITKIQNFSRDMSRVNLGVYASSTAFFLFLSLVPMLMVVCTIIPYTPLTEENLVTGVTEVLPDMMDPMAREVIADVYGQSAGILPVAALVMLWTAGKGVLALMRGLNAINGQPGKKRNYVTVRFIAAFYTLVMLVATVFSLVIMVFGNQLVDLLVEHIPQLGILVEFLMNFRFLFSWGALTLMFSAIYAYVPDKKLKFREQIPGGCFTAVLWSVFSWGFSLYVTASGSYSVYGSLSIIIIAMVWMYFCMYILLAGAYLNDYLNR